MERKSRVQMVETEGKTISSPRVIVGVPEAGLVGLIATSYMVQGLKLQEVGYVDSELLPQVVVVHGSEPRKSPITIFAEESERLLVVLSEIPLAPKVSYEFGSEVEAWSKSKGAEMVVSVTGVPSKRRMEGEADKKPSVFGLSNSKEIVQKLTRSGVQLFEEGMVGGTPATLLRRGMALGVPNLLLLVESYAEFPDPSAAVSAIEVLNSVLSIKTDTRPLVAESEGIRLRTRELMRRTQQNMQQAAEAPGVYA